METPNPYAFGEHEETDRQFVTPPNTHVLVRRFIALLIDSFFLSIPIALTEATFGVAQNMPYVAAPGVGISYVPYTSNAVVALPWLYLIAFLYFFLQEALFGTTMGKRIAGLKVVYGNEHAVSQPLTWQAAFIRNLVRPIDAIGGYLAGWILVLSSSQRRRLGDHLAGTLVVLDESVPDIPLKSSQFWLRLGALTVLIACFVAGCLTFEYYGRPPLVIAGEANTSQSIFGAHEQEQVPNGYQMTPNLNMITGLQLGQPARGEDTLTYPISFYKLDNGKAYKCQGHIILKWFSLAQGWEDTGGDTVCRPAP